MYTHTPFVTSGRLAVFLPQIAANASLSFFGAKSPFPAFFWAATFFLPDAERPFLADVIFSEWRVRFVAFVIVVFVVVAVVFVALEVVVA